MIHVIMPMAGLGTRFSHKGYQTPKPLINIAGQSMFQKALSSLDGLNANFKFHAVLRREHEENFGLATLIKKSQPNAVITLLNHPTRGAAETCLAALSSIPDRDSVLIMDCDLWFSAPDFLNAIKNNQNLDGALLTHHSSDPRFSFVKIQNDRAIETAEKKAISENAIIGAYYFSSKTILKNTIRRLLSRPAQGEYYISHLYNILIQNGAYIKVFKANQYLSYGTPEEVEQNIR